MEELKKNIWIAMQFMVAAMICGLIYGFVIHGFFTLRYIFPANFLLGAVIIVTAVVMLVMPSRPNGKLIDHSTYKEAFMEKREQKQKKGYAMLYLGICVIAIPAILQLVLSFII